MMSVLMPTMGSSSIWLQRRLHHKPFIYTIQSNNEVLFGRWLFGREANYSKRDFVLSEYLYNLCISYIHIWCMLCRVAGVCLNVSLSTAIISSGCLECPCPKMCLRAKNKRGRSFAHELQRSSKLERADAFVCKSDRQRVASNATGLCVNDTNTSGK